MLSTVLVAGLVYVPAVLAASYRVIGNSGCASQMVFLPPYSNKAVFIDNYHPNFGNGINMATGAHSSQAYKYNDGSNLYVFGTEFDLGNGVIRALHPKDNTFCSAGAFLKDGTLLNIAGAEAADAASDIEFTVNNWPVTEGFDHLRTYAPYARNQDWIQASKSLQVRRWYPSAQTLVDGSVLVVGGSNVGLLVLNEASINVPTYEIIWQDGRKPAAPVTLPILQFDASQNLVPGKSYNLYPILMLLPNSGNRNLIFTIAGTSVIIWDYTQNTLYKTLPNTPYNQPRTFPSSATAVLLPLVAPNYTPTVLLCGGSSGDMPNPRALNDCWTINPLDANPVWTATDSMPDGARTMGDGINLPDGTVLIVNGARVGCGGGVMATSPAFNSLIYNPASAAGHRWTIMPSSNIARLYHSVATLMPSGEVLISGSNPNVFYSQDGKVHNNAYPKFNNNGHTAALNQQQLLTDSFPTEYRVEVFSPNYMSAAKPVVSNMPASVNFGATFTLTAQFNGSAVKGNVQVMLSNPGFHTHGVAMGQRMVSMTWRAAGGNNLSVVAPSNGSIMPPGVYLIFVVVNGIPSQGQWIKLGS